MIEKSELKYIGFSMLVIGLLILSMNTSLYNVLSNSNPILQFVVINIGLYITFFFFIKSVALKEKFNRVFKGALGTTIGFISLDLVLPPYLVSNQGLLTGGLYPASSSDFFFGYIYSHYLGISGIALPIMVYFVTFIILFGIASLLIKNFVENL